MEKALRTVKVGEMSMNDMIGLMAGRKITEQYPPYEANPQEEVLKVDHLTTDKVTDISLHFIKEKFWDCRTGRKWKN